MNRGQQSGKHLSGFTIVELLIVVVVIAILAAITIVSYNGITNRAKTSSIKSDIGNAIQAMEVAKVDSATNDYPTAFPSNVKTSAGNALSLSADTNGFCINGEIVGTTTRYYYSSSSGGIQDGSCPGSVIANSELGIRPNIITDTTFASIGSGTSQWGVVVSGGGSVTTSTRSGISTDPYPTRPVLRIVNPINASATFSYLKGPITVGDIVGSVPYTVGYYVRIASGTHTGTIFSPGVMSGSATNSSIPQQSGAATPTTDWQKVSKTVTATQNGVAGTAIYMGLSLNDVKTNAFTLEFQGFEVRRAD
jgi:general secretion pathway protein G